MKEIEVEEMGFRPMPIIKEMQKVKKWQADDGQVFDSKFIAQAHEYFLELESEYQKEYDDRGDSWYFVESPEKWVRFVELVTPTYGVMSKIKPPSFPVWTLISNSEDSRYENDYHFFTRKTLETFLMVEKLAH